MARSETHSPGQRVDIGDAVLEAAKMLDTKPIKQRLARFAAAHKKFVAAEKNVVAADEKLATAQRKVADADVDQDHAVDALAAAIAADGGSRTKPFAKLGAPSPSVVQSTGYADEAKLCTKLAASAKKVGGKNTVKAAAALEKAAGSVVAALKAVPPFAKLHVAAIAQRQALAQEWETSLAALKRGARAAADDGAVGLYDALFASLPKRAAKPKTAPPPPPVAPAA